MKKLMIIMGLGLLILAPAVFVFAQSATQGESKSPSELLPSPSRNAPTPTTETTMKTTLAEAPWASSPPFSSHDFYKPLPLKAKEGEEIAILAGGCFWCLEAVYENIPGVIDVVSGYIGGDNDRPSYEFVSTGRSGHAEAVWIRYDAATVKYGDLLNYFWKIHDPTTKDRQGYDVGPQYRSGIFYIDEAQKEEAMAAIEKQSLWWLKPIVTEVLPAGNFWIAEESHQDFYRRNPDYGYCAVVIAPKLQKTGFGK
jgi:peptide-methionine (S)-S-oxide reductase